MFSSSCVAGETKAARIEWGRASKRCPYCGADLEGKRVVGSGSFQDGIFCSLDCFTRFHYGEPKQGGEHGSGGVNSR